jgi:hypothetical protein
MRKINSIIAIIAVSMAVSTTAFAQETATAATSSNVIAPISIASSNNGLLFGNMAVKSGSVGTVTLNPTTGLRETSNVTLPASNEGTVHAATFAVGGQTGYTYSIQLPTEDFNLTDGGTGEDANTMVVTDVVSDAETGTLDSEGTQTISVGATLKVASDQATGAYTNADDLSVIVNYN